MLDIFYWLDKWSRVVLYLRTPLEIISLVSKWLLEFTCEYFKCVLDQLLDQMHATVLYATAGLVARFTRAVLGVPVD